MKTCLFFFLLLQVSFVQSQTTGSIRGVVVDENHEPLPFVRVIVYSTGEDVSLITGAEADFDGRFLLSNISPGTYNIEFTDYTFGVDTVKIEGVQVQSSQITTLDTIEMMYNEVLEWSTGPSCPSTIRLNIDPFGRSTTIESEDIRRH